MILIISSYNDDHTIAILDQLKGTQAKVHLLDLSQFPQFWHLNIEYTHNLTQPFLKSSTEMLDLSKCKVIWWRRPQPFTLHADLTDPVYRSFAHTESHAAISGLWLLLDTVWINHPTRDDEASRKVYQLKVAQEIGFAIPLTCISNHPESIRSFIGTLHYDRVIYKAFSGTLEAWRETRLLKREEVELIDTTRFAPVIFQEYIPAALDLRITVMGENIFAAAIHSQDTNYKVDYRMEMDKAQIEAFSLPEDILKLIRQLMNRLQLVYGAIDMRLTPEGQFVFLEINPSGQWRFMEERTDLLMTETFAQLLISYEQL